MVLNMYFLPTFALSTRLCVKTIRAKDCTDKSPYPYHLSLCHRWILLLLLLVVVLVEDNNHAVTVVLLAARPPSWRMSTTITAAAMIGRSKSCRKSKKGWGNSAHS